MTLTAEQGGLYLATTSPQIIDVPDLTYLMIDGLGPPDGEDFDLAMRALYQVCFSVRGEISAAGRRTGTPLEALWGPPCEPMRAGRRPSWRWTLMLPQATAPARLLAAGLADAVTRVRDLVPPLPVDEVYVSVLREGRCVQAMHVGAYADEAATVSRLLAHAEANGYAPSGRHHEIYLSDPDQTAPQWLRTIVRLPVAPQF
ncbi:MAG TPA: GyrI-like domain-containing protein [Acidothermaceae bacterium]|jgi:hypothetical protein